MTSNLNWSDLYSGEQTVIEVDPTDVPTVTDPSGLPTTTWAAPDGQITELDDAGKALLALIPEPFREMAQVQLAPMLAAMRLQLGDDEYTVFCLNMEQAATLYNSGDKDGAYAILGAYGIPVDMLRAMEETAYSSLQPVEEHLPELVETIDGERHLIVRTVNEIMRL